MKKSLLIFFLLLLSLYGCSKSPEEEVEISEFTTATVTPVIPSLTDTPSPSPSATATISPTPTSTASPKPTNTPTETFTPSPTPVPLAIVEVSFAYVYPGVATYLPPIAGFSQNTNLHVLGITPDSRWMLVEIAPEQDGWIESKKVSLNDPEMPISTIEAPIPPTLTPTPVLPPRISVKSPSALDFYNFQAHENLSVKIYQNGKLTRSYSASTGENGFASLVVTRSGFSFQKGITYTVTVTGSKGSYVEKTFTY